MSPMESKYLSPALHEFFRNNPDLFMRCDRDGKENPQGDFWRAREAKRSSAPNRPNAVDYLTHAARCCHAMRDGL